MTVKERFIQWVEKLDRRQREQDSISSRYKRNRKYHSHFEGYTEYPQLQADGHVRIVRVYTGAYYRADRSNASYILSRIGYILLWALAVYCQVSAALTDQGYNYRWYVTVPEALGFPAAFLMMIMVFSAALCERKMLIRQYKRIHKRMPLIAFIGACILLVTAVCMTVYILSNAASAVTGIWIPPVKMLIASVCFIAIWFLERRIDYETIENPNKVSGGIEIQ